MSLDVKYPKIHRDFDFDAGSLPLVVSIWREMLILAEQMELEIDAYISLDTTRADDGQKLSVDQHGLTGPLVRFTHLMERFAVAAPAAAAAEAETWSRQGGVVFERLRIWGAGRRDLTTAEQAETVLTGMDDKTFWSSHHERDLYYTIRDRWSDLSDAGRRSIEARLLHSVIPYLEDPDLEDRDARVATTRLTAIQWFHEHGVAFGFDVDAEKARLLELAPNWNQKYTEWTAKPRTTGVYSVETDTDATKILDVPPDQLLPIETPKRGFMDRINYAPFAGYASGRPNLAVEALQSAMARNVDDIWSWWATFLRATREVETSAELDAKVVSLVVSLSLDDFAKFWYPLVDRFAPRAAAFDQAGGGHFDLVWDRVIEAAAVHPSGYKQKPERDWSFEAINSVIGRLVLALIEIKLPPGTNGIPVTWLSRLHKALNLQGDHARHAAYLVAQQSGWFNHWEPSWWDAELLPKSSDQGPDGDAFWSGFSRMHRVPEPVLFEKVKASLIQRVRKGDRKENNLVGHLLTGWGRPAPGQQVSDNELRDVLILGDDDVRQSALRHISNWSAEHQGWAKLVLPFLARVWPKQRTAKTAPMSSALFWFASTQPRQFAEIIDEVVERMVPLSRGHGMHMQCDVTDLDAAGIEALVSALERLLPEDRQEWPYDGKAIIQSMADAGVGQGSRFDELKRRADESTY